MRTSELCLAIALIASAVVSASRSYAATTEENYELQDRCGKRAEQLFRESWGNGISHNGDKTTLAGYTNHYNEKLNKCFMLLTTTLLTSKSTTYLRTLVDANENREIGSYDRTTFQNGTRPITFECQVMGEHCSTQERWDALAARLMSE